MTPGKSEAFSSSGWVRSSSSGRKRRFFPRVPGDGCSAKGSTPWDVRAWVIWLVVFHQPLWNICASQIGSFLPRDSGWKLKKYVKKHHLVSVFICIPYSSLTNHIHKQWSLTAKAPENIPGPKKKGSSSKHDFSGQAVNLRRCIKNQLLWFSSICTLHVLFIIYFAMSQPLYFTSYTSGIFQNFRRRFIGDHFFCRGLSFLGFEPWLDDTPST